MRNTVLLYRYCQGSLYPADFLLIQNFIYKKDETLSPHNANPEISGNHFEERAKFLFIYISLDIAIYDLPRTQETSSTEVRMNSHLGWIFITSVSIKRKCWLSQHEKLLMKLIKLYVILWGFQNSNLNNTTRFSMQPASLLQIIVISILQYFHLINSHRRQAASMVLINWKEKT